MKIYTKTGDSGTTSLYDGSRLIKSDDIFNVLGCNDELSSQIGLLITLLSNSFIKIHFQLRTIQANLQYINSIIATPNELKKRSLKQIENKDVEQLEKWIDEMEEISPKLTAFILPGVTIEDANAHICRTSCRKSERELYKLLSTQEHLTYNPNIMCYINRLSDYFFSLARYICHLKGEKDFKI